MSEDIRGVGGEKPEPEARGDAEPMNWACTVCGYRIEGELPDRCPDCGAGQADFEHVPVPGF